MVSVIVFLVSKTEILTFAPHSTGEVAVFTLEIRKERFLWFAQKDLSVLEHLKLELLVKEWNKSNLPEKDRVFWLILLIESLEFMTGKAKDSFPFIVL